MQAAERYRTLLDEAAELPHDQQVSALEDAVATADASLGGAEQAESRVQLAEAYQFGADPARAAVPFAWLSRRLDAGDASVEPWTESILWINKWIVNGLLQRPDVSLADIHDEVDRMRRRYAEAGEGPGPVLKCAFLVDAHVNGQLAAEASFGVWAQAPRTELSDCEACEPATRAWHLASVGRHREALDEIQHVLDGSVTCAEQPEGAISNALESLVHAGRTDEVAELFALAWRRLRRSPGNTDLVARLVEFCARTQNLSRGLALLRARAADLASPSTPYDGMLLAASGARLLAAVRAAGHGDVEVIDGVRADALADTLSAQALSTASAFDRRNGTASARDMVARTLASTDLGPVDLGAQARDALSGSTLLPERCVSPHMPELAEITADDVVALADAADAAWRWCGQAACRTVAERWETARDAALAGLDSADAWRLRAIAELEAFGVLTVADHQLAAGRAREAADLHRRAGQAGEALLCEQLAALIEGDAEGVARHGDEIERLGTVDEVLRARRRRLLVAREASEAAALIESMEEFARVGGAGWEGRVTLALALGVRTTPDADAALAAFGRGLALLEPDESPIARGDLLLGRAAALTELGRHGEADEDLAEASRLAWDAADPALWARTLALRADCAVDADNLVLAERLHGEAAAAALANGDRAAAVGCLLAQAANLATLGHEVQAAEVAETVLPLVDGEPEVAAMALSTAASYVEHIGDLPRARELAAAAVRAHAELGLSPDAITALAHLGHLEWRENHVSESVGTYAAALSQAQALGHLPLEAAVLRWRSAALFEAEGLEVALSSLEASETAIASAESAAWADADVADAWTDFDPDAERLFVRLSRTRLLGSVQRYADAIDALGPMDHYASHPVIADEAVALRDALLSDMAGRTGEADTRGLA